MKNFFSFLFASVFSISVGVLVGILIAPESGKRTRKQLKRRWKKFSDDFDDLTHSSQEVYKDVVESISDLRDTAEHTYERFANKK